MDQREILTQVLSPNMSSNLVSFAHAKIFKSNSMKIATK